MLEHQQKCKKADVVMAEHTYVCDRKPDQCGKDSAVRFAPRTVWQEAQAQSRIAVNLAPLINCA
ncbi:hypothetical protein D9F41_21440 [Escherichia coli]|nr:hypothetical protein [Escherichia coli]